MAYDILTAFETYPTRAQVVEPARALMKRLNECEGQDTVVLLTPESLEPINLDYIPTYEQLRELVGGDLTSTSTRCLRHHAMMLRDDVLLKPGATLNFLATVLYSTGHPICGVVVLMPHSTSD